MIRHSYVARWVALLMIVSLSTALAPATAFAEKQDARRHYEQATAAFGLGKYAEAATEYEAAFGLRPDPAFLYNAAQSYRLAGNARRALQLYQNYLRLYGEAQNADDARKHVADLEGELRPPTPAPALVPAPAVVAVAPTARPSAPSPSLKPAPVANPVVAATPAPTPAPIVPLSNPSPTPSPAPVASSAPALDLSAPPGIVAQATAPSSPEPTRDEGSSITSSPWFWAAIGGAVLAGVIAVVVVKSGDKDPKASLGTVMGN